VHRDRQVKRRLARESFHQWRADVLTHGGMDGVERVWAGVKSMSGVTEQAGSNGPGLNTGRIDPRGLTGIGPPSPPGWG
jgi:hypothetical protein